jgi:hypothetical protein
LQNIRRKITVVTAYPYDDLTKSYFFNELSYMFRIQYTTISDSQLAFYENSIHFTTGPVDGHGNSRDSAMR